jgi:hypothetical protein
VMGPATSTLLENEAAAGEAQGSGSSSTSTLAMLHAAVVVRFLTGAVLVSVLEKARSASHRGAELEAAPLRTW